MMEHAAKKPQIAILFFLISLANVLGVLYTAALPSLTDYFHITKADAQQTISFYLIGGLLAQAVYGPVAKAIGRKPAIYLGCSLALLGSAVCLISIYIHSFSLILFGRGLTAFGAGCGVILTSTLLADAFSYQEQKKILSYLMSAFAIFPAIGITIGGFITEYVSWQGCFYFMLLYSLFVSGLCVLLPETAKDKGSHHLHPLRVAKAYFKQFSHLLPTLYALMVACASITLYTFSAEAPFIAKNQLQITPNRFGLYNLIPNIGLLVGGIASAHLSHRISSKTLLLIGGCGFFLFSAAMWIFFDVGFINVLTLFGIPMLVFFVTPIILSHGQAASVSISEDKVYASSSVGILQYFWMFLIITCLGFFPPENASALPIVYSCSGLLILVLWLVIQFVHKKHSGD